MEEGPRGTAVTERGTWNGAGEGDGHVDDDVLTSLRDAPRAEQQISDDGRTGGRADILLKAAESTMSARCPSVCVRSIRSLALMF